MSFAIINKIDHLVQEIRQTSAELNGYESVYEVETEFDFGQDFIPNAFEHRDSTFKKLADYPLVQIDRTWRLTFSDYKSARIGIFVAMITKGGFDNLPLEEKQIASKWFVVGRTERNSVHTVEEQVENGLIYNTESINARSKRLSKCMIEAYNRLTDEQIQSIMATMNFSKTAYAYVEAGQEGTLEGNPEGLFDYIQARTGTQWETTGLRVQNYTPIGYNNCQELSDRLMDILVNGNY